MKQVEAKCPIPDCRAELQWQKCDAKCYWISLKETDNEGNIVILYHKGILLILYKYAN